MDNTHKKSKGAGKSSFELIDSNKLKTILPIKPGSVVIDLACGDECAECFDNNMTCKVGNIMANHSLECNQQFVALITEGDATANGISVSKGDLLEGDSLHIKAISKTGMVPATDLFGKTG